MSKPSPCPFEAFDYRKPNPYASLGRLGVELSVFRKYATYTLPLVAIFYAMFRRQRATLIHLNNHVYSHRSEIICSSAGGHPLRVPLARSHRSNSSARAEDQQVRVALHCCFAICEGCCC